MLSTSGSNKALIEENISNLVKLNKDYYKNKINIDAHSKELTSIHDHFEN